MGGFEPRPSGVESECSANCISVACSLEITAWNS